VKRLALALALTIGPATFGVVERATAQTDAEKDAARILFTEGKELREAGKLELALDRFKRAHELAPTPITTLEFGRTHAMLGHLVEARRLYRSIEAMEIKPGESAKASAAREEGKLLAANLDARIPTVLVKVVPPDAVVTATLDGRALDPKALAVAIPLDPGKHVLVVQTVQPSVGKETRLPFEVVEGEKERVVTVSVGKEPPPIAPPPKPAESGWTPLRWTSVVVGGVGLLVGGGAGLLALGGASSLKQNCPAGQCPPDRHADLDTTRRWATVSNIGFVVGALGATVFVITLVREPRKSEVAAVSVVPYASPAGFGLSGRF